MGHWKTWKNHYPLPVSFPFQCGNDDFSQKPTILFVLICVLSMESKSLAVTNILSIPYIAKIRHLHSSNIKVIQKIYWKWLNFDDEIESIIDGRFYQHWLQIRKIHSFLYIQLGKIEQNYLTNSQIPQQFPLILWYLLMQDNKCLGSRLEYVSDQFENRNQPE